jgi:protein-tyrosine phosphatase
MVKILFVCLGNICRSPLAEGIFQQMIDENGLTNKYQCDSCGTSTYHIGQQSDPRTVANAKQNDVFLDHKAREFNIFDFEEFDYIIPMDLSNMIHIRDYGESENRKAIIHLMREYDPINPGTDVPDPYFGGEKGFQSVFDILKRSCRSFLRHLEETH